MTERKSQKKEVERDHKHADTEGQKHQAGGPGKSARKGHIDSTDTGNAPSQQQSGPGAPHGRKS